MSVTLTPETIAKYRATAQQRWAEEAREQTERRDRALVVARQAATVLKEEFKASRVAAFGSIVHGYWFSPTSDLDLAVWGLTGDDYFVAVARLQELSPEFKVDLVMMEQCRPALAEIIEKGMTLL